LTITGRYGYCIGPDWTLAGSNLNIAQAVRNAREMMGVDDATAIRMATAVPASAIGLSGDIGSIAPGLRADFVLVDANMKVIESWIGGEPTGPVAGG
jgi:N-acetylglucosamine-6-phosphate deacetylase